MGFATAHYMAWNTDTHTHVYIYVIEYMWICWITDKVINHISIGLSLWPFNRPHPVAHGTCVFCAAVASGEVSAEKEAETKEAGLVGSGMIWSFTPHVSLVRPEGWCQILTTNHWGLVELHDLGPDARSADSWWRTLRMRSEDAIFWF